MEVFRDNQWGSVEDATFFLPEGNVICRSLGYGTVKRYHHDSYFGFGIGPANVPKINCRGNESTHENCSLSRPELRSQHANDVGIECNRPLERCQEVVSPVCVCVCVLCVCVCVGVGAHTWVGSLVIRYGLGDILRVLHGNIPPP